MLMLPVACLLALPVQHPDQKALEDAWVDAKPSIPEPLALQFQASVRLPVQDAQHRAQQLAERLASLDPRMEQQ
jgi:hypothetical protein